MSIMYTSEKNVQILVSLLKAHNIKKIIISPGTTNVCFTASVQCDDFFELYSSADERSAAYMACGMVAETGEPVVLSCTGATASRNYMPALTEAFYRKLPILVVTSSRMNGMIGQNMDQVTDRIHLPFDIVKNSVQVPIPRTEIDEWACNNAINTAIVSLKNNGGGPSHINLNTEYDSDFSCRKLPIERKIDYYDINSNFPELVNKKIGIFVGAHIKWNEKLVKCVDDFCEKYNAIVLCDQGGNYKGKYQIYFSIIMAQRYSTEKINLDIMIHIGEISGSYFDNVKEVWRVSKDGKPKDTFKKLTKIFEIDEYNFFECYNKTKSSKKIKNYEKYNNLYNELVNIAKEKVFPFSNMWVALNIHDRLPKNSILHLGILNSLRCYNYLKLDDSILTYSNTGGFGIDGSVSTLIGASLCDKNKLCFGVVGDLAFFYDMNSLGNRHIGKNIRLLIINNGMGAEFKNKANLAQKAGLGNDANPYISASGHYGNKSKELVKNYVSNLGYEYLQANNKQEFLDNVDKFLNPNIMDKSIVLEVFTTDKNETDSLEIMATLKVEKTKKVKAKTKNAIKKIIGEKNITKIKKIIKKK